MARSQRDYAARIHSTQSLKQIFKAMELIAASRIGKARARMDAAAPYAQAITRAVSAVAAHATESHRLINQRTDVNRVGMLVMASDRGMAGAYSASILREAERVIALQREEGKEVRLYAFGRRAVSFFTFRGYELAGRWEGESDAPTLATATEISNEALRLFTAAAEEGGCSELHLVHTRFLNMVRQEPRALRLLPLEVVEESNGEEEHLAHSLYEFEPDPQVVMDDLLPQYIRARIFSCLLQSAASELAARQRAMHTATDNAQELIRTYTRLKNQARQAEITQEISEIVSGADALAAN